MKDPAALSNEKVGRIWEHAVKPYLQERLFSEPERMNEFELAALRDAISGDAARNPTSHRPLPRTPSPKLTRGDAVGSEPTILTEYTESEEAIRLDTEERDALQGLVPGMLLRPIPGETDLYKANPGDAVGAVQLGDRRFELRPKIAIRRLAFVLAYSMDPSHWRQSGFDFEEEADIFEAVIPGFAYQVEEALRRGLLQGYRTEEASLQTVRGRIRFDDQLRSSFGLIPPIECRFDEFTEDIEINRLLKAAIDRAGQIRIRDRTTRHRLRALRSAFETVASVTYDPRAVPEIDFNRLNLRFRAATEFARLILRSRSIEFRSGEVSGAAFLLRMDSGLRELRHRRASRGASDSRSGAFPRGRGTDGCFSTKAKF